MKNIGDVITHRKLEGEWVIINVENVYIENSYNIHDHRDKSYMVTIRPITKDNQIGSIEKRYYLSGFIKEDKLLENARTIRSVQLGYVVV